MKKIFTAVFICSFLFACHSDKPDVPDVSGIAVDVKLERFDKGFFGIDSNSLNNGLQQLQTTYPNFYPDYMQGILGVSGVPGDTTTQKMTRIILGNYSSLYKEAESELSDFPGLEKELKKGFQFVKYYFPAYKIPGLITFVGTLDAPGIVMTEKYIAIGLHQYAGRHFAGYQNDEVRRLYPDFISRRFEAKYIPVNSMKAIVQDLFPDNSQSKPLIEQMIEKGKQWWLLDKFMPEAADSLKTGYTQQELNWCKENEGLIWSYIVKNEDLRSINPGTIQIYLGESPFTQGFSQELSPGNIGQWIGWQIVKKYAANNPTMKPEDVMKSPAQKILEEAKYRPK